MTNNSIISFFKSEFWLNNYLIQYLKSDASFLLPQQYRLDPKRYNLFNFNLLFMTGLQQ